MDITRNKFKISIRISIISLFILLLGSIGTIIIAINHFTLNSILLSSAKNLMQEVNTNINNRLLTYLLPLRHDLLEASNLLSKGVVSPTKPKYLNYLLFEIINHNNDIYGVYFATPEGNFYGIDRESGNKLTLQHIIRSKQAPYNIRYALDQNGEIIKETHLKDLSYDPRKRPWYQMALFKKRAIWTDIYEFHLFNSNQSYFLPGITAAAPVYNSHGKLLGVIGIDLTISRLMQFIRSLDLTKNTIIYIINQYNHLVAFRGDMNHQDVAAAENLIGKKLTPSLMKQLRIPVSEELISHSSSTAKRYHIAGREYFIINEPIIHGDNNIWYVTIIVPAADIVGVLKDVSIVSLILTIFSLLCGIFIVRYISQRISLPIIKLANEAKAITELDLTQPKPTRTIIKEISYMDATFDTMRNSLRSFQRYVPSSLVKNLVKSRKLAEIGGESMELSFLFSDIKNFTHLAESIEPQRLTHILSAYFETMTQAVILSHGTLDKYIGDAVMAFWNAPLPVENHALQACQTAIDMRSRLKVLNQYLRHESLPELEIRIGINTGLAIVGNVGSQERLSYTAIGDNVNLSSRLEALNKVYGTHIIVSEKTYELVKEYFTFRLLDHVAVRGKEKGVIIYQLVADDAKLDTDYQPRFLKAFELYQQGDWEQSHALFVTLAIAYPDDPIPSVFIKRCQWLMETKPASWNGIWSNW